MQYNDHVTQMNMIIPYFTGIPEDVIVNTWHAIYSGGGNPTNTNFAAFAGHLQLFYNAVYAANQRGSWVSTPNARVKAYNLWDPAPHVPVYSANVPITGAASAGTTPTEGAICLSYQADYISGVPPARQRGRIYLGGFGQMTAAGGASLFPSVDSATRSAIGAAATAFRNSMALSDWDWVVASPTQNAEGGQETFNVARGWIDNTPDTQRRRGFAATARTLWS